jgi:hypothetical protein
MSDNFNIDRAITAAHWAGMAYGKDEFPAGFNCQWVTGLPANDVQCLVITEQDRITFAFRGTFDNRGWLQDAKIAFTEYGGIKMHRGFFEDVDAVFIRLSAIAKAAALPVYITGHSKGAGECLVFAYRLATELGITAKEIFTFGGPRVFNRAGSRAYETLLIPTWRVLDEDDIVCRIPWRLGLYRHVGQSAFFDGWGNMAENEPFWAHIPSDLYVLLTEAWQRKNAPSYDHGIDRYKSRLLAWKDRIS